MFCDGGFFLKIGNYTVPFSSFHSSKNKLSWIERSK